MRSVKRPGQQPKQATEESDRQGCRRRPKTKYAIGRTRRSFPNPSAFEPRSPEAVREPSPTRRSPPYGWRSSSETPRRPAGGERDQARVSSYPEPFVLEHSFVKLREEAPSANGESA